MRWYHWAIIVVLIVALGGVALYKISGNGNGTNGDSPFHSTQDLMNMAHEEAIANRVRREANESYRDALLQPIKDVIQYIDDMEHTWDDYSNVSEDLKARARSARTLLQERLQRLEGPLGAQNEPAGGASAAGGGN